MEMRDLKPTQIAVLRDREFYAGRREGSLSEPVCLRIERSAAALLPVR